MLHGVLRKGVKNYSLPVCGRLHARKVTSAPPDVCVCVGGGGNHAFIGMPWCVRGEEGEHQMCENERAGHHTLAARPLTGQQLNRLAD